MTKEELKNKIMNILNFVDTSAALTTLDMNFIADALIEAEIGDVKELDSIKTELRQKVDYINELWEVKEDYKHRAAKAERALKNACTNVIKDEEDDIADEEDDIAVEPRANVLYKAYLRQAEKELAEVEDEE